MVRATDSLWQMRFCIPFWVIELFWVVLEIGITSFALAVVQSDSDEIDSDLQQDGVQDAASFVNRQLTRAFVVALVFYIIILLMTVGEIVLYCINRLNPIVYLIFNVLKAAFWLVILILDIVNNVNDNISDRSIILSAVIFICFLAPMIYGAVIFHRYRRSGGGTGGLRRTYTAVERGRFDADTRDTSRLNPFDDASFETRSNHSGTYFRTHSRHPSATEMGDIPDPTARRYEDGELPSVAGTRPDSRTGLRRGAIEEYYQPPAPERTGVYEEYRALSAAATVQGKGQGNELGFGS